MIAIAIDGITPRLGVVGTAGAIANAVYHATRIRVRDLPITLDKLVPSRRRSLCLASSLLAVVAELAERPR
jgi:hypothetical protein